MPLAVKDTINLYLFMKLSPGHRKRILLLFALPVFFLLVCAGIFYYILIFRFKDSLRYIVTKESKGRYSFDASEAEIVSPIFLDPEGGKLRG